MKLLLPLLSIVLSSLMVHAQPIGTTLDGDKNIGFPNEHQRRFLQSDATGSPGGTVGINDATTEVTKPTQPLVSVTYKGDATAIDYEANACITTSKPVTNTRIESLFFHQPSLCRLYQNSECTGLKLPVDIPAVNNIKFVDFTNGFFVGFFGSFSCAEATTQATNVLANAAGQGAGQAASP